MQRTLLNLAFELGKAYAAGLNSTAEISNDAAKWITIHPNGKGYNNKGDKIKGRSVLIDTESGQILGGLGGKFTGQKVNKIHSEAQRAKKLSETKINAKITTERPPQAPQNTQPPQDPTNQNNELINGKPISEFTAGNKRFERAGHVEALKELQQMADSVKDMPSIENMDSDQRDNELERRYKLAKEAEKKAKKAINDLQTMASAEKILDEDDQLIKDLPPEKQELARAYQNSIDELNSFSDKVTKACDLFLKEVSKAERKEEAEINKRRQEKERQQVESQLKQSYAQREQKRQAALQGLPHFDNAVNNAKTVAEITQAAVDSKMFNGKAPKLEGLSLQTAKDTMQAYSQLYKRFSILAGNINPPQYVHEMGKKEARTYAFCRPALGGLIELNGKFYAAGKEAELAQSFKKTVESGYHPAGLNEKSIVVHELGHALDGFLSYTLKEAGTSKMKANLVSKELQKSVLKAVGIDKSQIKQEVSEYAREDPQEFFAECFAEYMCSPKPRRVAVEFGRQLEALVKQAQERENGRK